MVSPELLRRYPFFGPLNDAQLKAVATIAEETSFPKGVTIFEECGQADTLFLLISGSVELSYRHEETFPSKEQKDFHVGDINPGEIFSISALIDPYVLNATAKAATESHCIQFDAVALRKMMEEDVLLGYRIMTQTTKTAMERISDLRVQLAAAWS